MRDLRLNTNLKQFFRSIPILIYMIAPLLLIAVFAYSIENSTLSIPFLSKNKIEETIENIRAKDLLQHNKKLKHYSNDLSKVEPNFLSIQEYNNLLRIHQLTKDVYKRDILKFLLLLNNGYTSSEIAAILFVDEQTLHNYWKKIQENDFI